MWQLSLFNLLNAEFLTREARIVTFLSGFQRNTAESLSLFSAKIVMPLNSTLSSVNFSTEAPVNTTELFLEPDGLKSFRLSLFSLVIFASLLGNFIICKTVWEIPHRKPFSYYLVANLAVAELINSLCTLFIMVYMEKGSWVFGKAMCILVNPLLVLSMFVITNSLATIAVYRYRVMLDKTRPTGLVMTGIIAGIWMMALAITLPLFITRKLVQMPEKYFTCQSYFPGDIVPNTANYNKYTIVRLVFTFAVPYFVILSTYVALAIKLKLYVRQIAKEDDYVGIGLSDSPAICGAKPGNASNPRRMDDNIEPVETEDNTRKRRRNGKMLIDTAENYLLRTV